MNWDQKSSIRAQELTVNVELQNHGGQSISKSRSTVNENELDSRTYWIRVRDWVLIFGFEIEELGFENEIEELGFGLICWFGEWLGFVWRWKDVSARYERWNEKG